MTPLEFIGLVVGGALAVAFGSALAPHVAPLVAWCVGAPLDLIHYMGWNRP